MLASPGTILFTALVGVLVVAGRTETLTSRDLPPGVGPQTLTAERPRFMSLGPDGWLADAVCWCGRRADQTEDSQRVVSVRGGSRTVIPSVLRHSAWPEAWGSERQGSAGIAPEIRPRSQMAATYLETDLAKGTGAASAHVGTAPLQPDGWDVRWGLMEMAAAQRGQWETLCPCPVYASEYPPDGPR
jgi:hypothetical protein